MRKDILYILVKDTVKRRIPLYDEALPEFGICRLIIWYTAPSVFINLVFREVWRLKIHLDMIILSLTFWEYGLEIGHGQTEIYEIEVDI